MKGRLSLSRGHRLDALALAAYVVLSLGFCYPLPLRLTTHVAGRYVDTRVFQWNNWWLKHALLNGLDLDYTDFIYYPSGASLVSHNVNWVSSFLSIPLDLLFGPAVAYNLTFLLTFFLSAFAMYLLVHHVTRHRGAAFVAGLVFAFFPYHVSGNFDGQMNLANIQWIPLCILFVLRVVDHRKVWDAVWAGFFAALASLDCWFFALFTGMWALLYLVYFLIFERKRATWRTMALFLLSAATALVLLAPFLVPLIRESARGSVSGSLDYFADDKAADLVAFLTPSSDHPLLSRYTESAYARFRHWRPVYLGYVSLALAFFAVVTTRRSILWMLTGIVFAVLALGTTLGVNGVAYPGVPLPFRLLVTWFPVLKIIRQANRFSIMISVSLAALVGLACADLFRRLQELRPWVPHGALALVGVLILFEYLAFPCPLSPVRVSPFYEALAQEEGDFALLELPIDDFHSRESLYPQTIHGKKLVNGYVARTPEGARGFLDSHPLIKKLQYQIEIDPALHDIAEEIEVLAANGIRYVVVHKRALPPQPPVNPEVLASWRALLGPETHYEDEEIAAFKLPPAPAYSALRALGGGLAVAEVRVRRTQVLDEQSLAVRVTWRAQERLSEDYLCRVVLAGPDGGFAGAEAEVISPKYPTHQWVPGTVVAEQYALPIDPSLPGGQYTVVLSALDPLSGSELGRLEYDVMIGKEVTPFVPALDDLQFLADVVYGDEMWFLGYTPHQEVHRLVIEMYWQALQAMQTNYKVFVQLVRPADGAIVTQVDTMPRNWSYPTSRWARREVFVDRIELDVTGVAPGAYRLAAGVYDPDSGRLPAVDGGGRPLQDGRAILEETVALPLESR
jgi:hypothetical protein